MKKKVISAVLAVSIGFGSLFSVPVLASDQAWEGDVSHIVMTYLTLGQTPAGRSFWKPQILQAKRRQT